MTKYLRISSYIRKPFLILYKTLQPLPSKFPYILGKSILFFISAAAQKYNNQNPLALKKGIEISAVFSCYMRLSKLND
jgi:hypothetical protein